MFERLKNFVNGATEHVEPDRIVDVVHQGRLPGINWDRYLQHTPPPVVEPDLDMRGGARMHQLSLLGVPKMKPEVKR